jgi:hypothetical protein
VPGSGDADTVSGPVTPNAPTSGLKNTMVTNAIRGSTAVNLLFNIDLYNKLFS